MIYGETGVMPLALNIKHRVISYWARLIKNIHEDETIKLSSKMYQTIYELHSKRKIKSQWLDNVKQYLCSSGFSGIWYSQSFINTKWITKSSYQRLQDIYIQTWHSDINQTSNSNLYKYVKPSFKRSYYLNKLPNHLCKSLIKFYTRNHRLPVETGRWRNIPYNDRKCMNCGEVGDEFHFLFSCPIFHELRGKYLDKFVRTRPNMQKFIALINSNNVDKLKNLSIFCWKIMQYFT